MELSVGGSSHKRIATPGKVIDPDPSIAVPNKRLGDRLDLIDSLIL
jgi:hypothetical protein